MILKCREGRIDARYYIAYGNNFLYTVDLTAGLDTSLEQRIQHVKKTGREAVICYGSGGMNVEPAASEYGHQFTLFKNDGDRCGILHYDGCGLLFQRYPVNNYMKWLVVQVNLSTIRVWLSIKAYRRSWRFISMGLSP